MEPWQPSSVARNRKLAEENGYGIRTRRFALVAWCSFADHPVVGLVLASLSGAL
jgi:hypothetical protein